LFAIEAGIGRVIGPALGGLLARPAIQYPSVFSSGGVWARFPYLLACLTAFFFALMCLIGVYFWLPETLNKGSGVVSKAVGTSAKADGRTDSSSIELSTLPSAAAVHSAKGEASGGAITRGIIDRVRARKGYARLEPDADAGDDDDGDDGDSIGDESNAATAPNEAAVASAAVIPVHARWSDDDEDDLKVADQKLLSASTVSGRSISDSASAQHSLRSRSPQRLSVQRAPNDLETDDYTDQHRSSASRIGIAASAQTRSRATTRVLVQPTSISVHSRDTEYNAVPDEPEVDNDRVTLTAAQTEDSEDQSAAVDTATAGSTAAVNYQGFRGACRLVFSLLKRRNVMLSTGVYGVFGR